MNKKSNTVIAVFLVCAVLFVMFNSFRSENAPYVKYTARVGTYVVSTQADALLVRDEYVIEPDITGVMEPSVSEGERVSAYSRVGAVITGNIDPGKISELNSLAHEIDSLTRTLSESGILTIADDKIDSALDVALNSLRYSASKNDTAESVLQAENIYVLTERKNGITTSSTAQLRLNEAIERRNRIAAGLGGSHKDIYAGVSGIYSDNMDSLESVLTTKFVTEATPEAIDDAFKQLDNKNAKGMCKIINNYKWYLVFNLPENECSDLKTGRDYTVNFKDLNNIKMTGTVKYISAPSEDKRCAVSMEFDRYIEDFTLIRRTSIEICKQEYSGIYIPRSAVSVEGVQGVWVQNEVKPVFKSIVEVYRSDDFVLVDENAQGIGGFDNIELYDSIILNPDNKEKK